LLQKRGKFFPDLVSIFWRVGKIDTLGGKSKGKGIIREMTIKPYDLEENLVAA